MSATDVKCPSCPEGMMGLVEGWETPRALRCACGEYFYARSRSMTAVRQTLPRQLERALDLVLSPRPKATA